MKIHEQIRRYSLPLALAAIVLFFQALTRGVLLSPLNITNIFLQNSYILVLAVGMLFCLVSGGNIDLSVGSVAAFTGALAGVLLIEAGWSVPVTLVLVLLAGALIGAWQGYWIAYFRIPSFIVTLAGMLVFRGLTLALLKGKTLAPFPNFFQKISAGFIPDFPGVRGVHVVTLLVGAGAILAYIVQQVKEREKRKQHQLHVFPLGYLLAKVLVVGAIIGFLSFQIARYKGLPSVLVLLSVLTILYSFLAEKTIIGRHIYAFGGNERTARLSGVKTRKLLFLIYVNMGLLASLAGIIFSARLNAATPKAGTLFELDAIAAVFIGGASAAGGIGTISGAIIGGITMGVLNNGMSIMGIGVDWQQTIKGLVLLAAVAFDLYSRREAQG